MSALFSVKKFLFKVFVGFICACVMVTGVGMQDASAAVVKPQMLYTVTAKAGAVVIKSGKAFNLKSKQSVVMREKPLAGATVMQSFAFDPINGDTYTAQLCTVPQAPEAGCMIITRFPKNGAKKQSMKFRAFGHGVSLAIERSSSKAAPYIWIEGKAGKPTKKGGKDAFGTRIARVKWKANSTIKYSKSVDRTPSVVVNKEPMPTIDHKNNLLIIRTRAKKVLTFRAYRLSDASSNKWSKMVYQVTAPLDSRAVHQGFAVYDSFIYLYGGSSYEKVKRPGNTLLQSYKICNPNTTKLQKAKHVQTQYKNQALYQLTFREPEGLSIYNPGKKNAALAFGFASGKIGSRKASIVIKTGK